MPNVPLAEVDPKQAANHALWEARTCIDASAFCAALAMMRKVIDLWRADHRERHGLSFDSKAAGRDNVYWRLQKIAMKNELYANYIHEVIDELRLDANDAIHNAMVCAGDYVYDQDTLESLPLPQDIKAPYYRLLGMVSGLVSMTMSRGGPQE